MLVLWIRCCSEDFRGKWNNYKRNRIETDKMLNRGAFRFAANGCAYTRNTGKVRSNTRLTYFGSIASKDEIIRQICCGSQP